MIFMPPQAVHGRGYIIMFSLCAIACPVVPMSSANMDSSTAWVSPLYTCSDGDIK